MNVLDVIWNSKASLITVILSKDSDCKDDELEAKSKEELIEQCGNLFELKDLLAAHAIFKTKNNIKFNEDVSFHKEFTRKTKVIEALINAANEVEGEINTTANSR